MARPLVAVLLALGGLVAVTSGAQIASGEWEPIWKWTLGGGIGVLAAAVIVWRVGLRTG
jgi:hypothetical protein